MTAQTRRTLAAVALLAAGAARPLAAQTAHFGADARATFAAAATTPVTNDLSSGGPTYAFGALGTGTVSGNGVATINQRIFATGGGLPVPAFTFTFSGPLGAFGADFTDLGTFPADSPYPRGVAEFRFFNGTTTVGTFTQNFGTAGATTFFGLTGLAAFNRVELRTNVGDEFFTDNVVVGAAAGPVTPPVNVVPEPGTWALLGTGLAALAGAARRRRATA